jgi:dihydrofolate synthase/folylpolyglutamate synthase
MKFGLRNIRILLAACGHPENRFPSIHVAGTNGKGSTSAFLASVFQEAGYTTGLYTSPHLVRFTERIRIDGKEIPERRVVSLLETMRPVIEKTGATFFEATTCIAFKYFAEEGVDIGIIEVGLGGRLDATNVVVPLASVITNVGFDHMEYLGPSIRSIAAEKGGIIKQRVPVVIGTLQPPADETIARIARRRQAPLTRAASRIELDCGTRGRISFSGNNIRTGLVRIGLEGNHQMFNAGLAVALLDVLVERKNFADRFGAVTSRAVARGLARVVRNTGLQGRLSVVGRDRRVLLDVAHNQDGMHTAVSSMLSAGIRNLTAVFGVMKDKAYLPMLKQLGWIADAIITVQPVTPRAATSATLCKAARRMGIAAIDGGSVSQGLRRALRRKGRILVIGSHYVVGESLQFLKKKKA